MAPKNPEKRRHWRPAWWRTGTLLAGPSLRHTLERVQCGEPIANFPHVADKIAIMRLGRRMPAALTSSRHG